MLNEHAYLVRNVYLVIFIKAQILALIEYCAALFMYHHWPGSVNA